MTGQGARHTSGGFSDWSTYGNDNCRSSAAISANRRQHDWLE